MASTVGTRSVYSLQFLAPTPTGSTEWVTHLQTDTEGQAWEWIDRLEREYPAKRWRWILKIQDFKYKQA